MVDRIEYFVVAITNGNSSLRFVDYLRKNSISTSLDIDDAIICNSLEDAHALRRLVIDRIDVISDDIKVIKIVTTLELI